MQRVDAEAAVNRACIAVVDANRARIYAYQPTVELARGDQLCEPIELVNPARATGADRDQAEARFARAIVAELDRLVREHGYAHVIVVATPAMLGAVQRADGVLHRPDVVLDELPRDLVKLTSPQGPRPIAPLAEARSQQIAAS